MVWYYRHNLLTSETYTEQKKSSSMFVNAVFKKKIKIKKKHCLLAPVRILDLIL